jgi:hypothetical protein
MPASTKIAIWHGPFRAIESGNMSDASLPQYDASTYIGYFDPKQPIADLLGNLPHWRQEGVTHFVTFRLADSIPQSTLRLWLRAWSESHTVARLVERTSIRAGMRSLAPAGSS